jgi:hypothetical protein
MEPPSDAGASNITTQVLARSAIRKCFPASAAPFVEYKKDDLLTFYKSDEKTFCLIPAWRIAKTNRYLTFLVRR